MLQRAFRFLFPPVSIKRTPSQLVVETPGLTRVLLFSFLVVYAGMFIAAALTFSPETLRVLIGNAFVVGGIIASVPFWAAMVDLVSPAERVTVDAASRLLTREKRVLWLWIRRGELEASKIRETFIDSAEVADSSDRPTGQLAFHPMLRLANGTVERVITRWSFARDEARAIAAAIAELLSMPARTDPVLHATPEELEQNKLTLARAEQHSGLFGARLIGGVFLLGALSTSLMALREVHFRQDAEIIGAAPHCAFTWRLQSDQREIKHAPCDSKPTPDRARPDSKPQVRQGLLFDVRLSNADAQQQRHRVFVGSPEAEQVRERGRVAVFWDPANPEAIRPADTRPLAMPLVLLAIGLLILLLPELRRLGTRAKST